MYTFQKIDAKEEDYLYIQDSQITNAGKGLYTAIDIYKDEIISYFIGEELPQHEAERRESIGESEYFMTLPNGNILDCKHLFCFAKFANDASGSISSIFKNNASIAMNDEEKICLVAHKKIKAGEEIFVSYGKKYWGR
ncbi:MAG: hypothetical protein RLZZ546_1672 [Bacteroidota bacterium]|jgi:SET domain-containing protein